METTLSSFMLWEVAYPTTLYFRKYVWTELLPKCFLLDYFIQISYFPMLVHHHTQVYCLYSLLTPQYIIMFTIPRQNTKSYPLRLGDVFKENCISRSYTGQSNFYELWYQASQHILRVQRRELWQWKSIWPIFNQISPWTFLGKIEISPITYDILILPESWQTFRSYRFRYFISKFTVIFFV